MSQSPDKRDGRAKTSAENGKQGGIEEGQPGTCWFTPEIRLEYDLTHLNLQPLTQEAKRNQLAYYKDDAQTITERWTWERAKFWGRDDLPYTFPDIPNDSPEYA